MLNNLEQHVSALISHTKAEYKELYIIQHHLLSLYLLVYLHNGETRCPEARIYFLLWHGLDQGIFLIIKQTRCTNFSNLFLE